MKVSFMSGIHGSPDGAAAALEAFQREGARHIAFPGDHGSLQSASAELR